MRYRAQQIKLKPKKRNHEELIADIKKALGRRDIENVVILRESIDARKKPNVKLVYTVEFDCDKKLRYEVIDPKEQSNEKGLGKTKDPGKTKDQKKTAIIALQSGFSLPDDFQLPDGESRPVIVGFGPCGMFAALALAKAGLRPIVIERGKTMDQRIRDVEDFWKEAGKEHGASQNAPDPESNVQFGEGGAGTFSDGKLTTGIKDKRIRSVLEEFVNEGADPAILYKAKPHIGTDRLRQIVPRIRNRIESLGGEVRFQSRLDDLSLSSFTDGSAPAGKRLQSVHVTDLKTNTSYEIKTEWLILAIGHSARDTFQILYEKGLWMERKPFSIGVRVEHPQEMINKAQYGDEALADILGPADYKLHYRCDDGRGVYTFCMCPGGHVINASSEKQSAVTNGMSNSAREGEYANSAVLVDVRTEDVEQKEKPNHPLSGIAFQQKYERLAWEAALKQGRDLPKTTYKDFRMNQEEGRNEANLVRSSLPAFASESILKAMPQFGKKLAGFDRDDAVFTAVESRSSSPVRIKRDEGMQAVGHMGIIPAGEGPGYAGGIMSAAVDGIRAAEKIIEAWGEKYSQKCEGRI